MPTNTPVRSRTKGLKDIYVALVTQNEAGGYTAGTPTKLARAITAKISDKYTSEKIFSDDGVEEIISNYEGTDIEFEVNSLAPQDRALLFGHLYENGYLVKSKDDVAPEVAVGFRAKKLNGKYEFTWYYCGKFGDGNEDNYETQAEKVKTQTNSLKGSFYERQSDGKICIQVDESNLLEANTSATAAMASWFAEVQEKSAS